MNRIRGRWQVAGLAACGMLVHVAAASADDIKLPKTMAWTAYDVGSTGYNQAVAIGSALKNKVGATLRVLPGKNDVARLAPLRDGKVDFSATGSDSVYAQEGLYVFGSETWGPIPIRMLSMNIGGSASTVLTAAADSGIRTLADLKGKRIARPKGAPTITQLTSAILAYSNMTLADMVEVETAGFAASAEAVINGSADVYLSATATPNNVKLDASPRGLHFIPVPFADPEGWTRLKGVVPWMFQHKATVGPTLSAEKPIEVATTAYPLLIGLASTPDEAAYGMTKAMYVLFDAYKDAVPGAEGWALSSQKLGEVFQPIHPGAIRYYKEIGFWKPEYEQVHNDNLARQKVVLDAWAGFFPTAPKGDEKAFEAAWLSARAAALRQAGMVTIIEKPGE